MHINVKPFLPTIAVSGAVISLFLGVRSIVIGVTSLEGTIAIILLLLLSTSLAVALGIQALTYGRAARYAAAMPELLRLSERIWRYNPETLTGTQATEICDRMVDALAKTFSQVSRSRCHVSIEMLVRKEEGAFARHGESGDFLVINLTRDSAGEGIDPEDRRRHPVEANSAYRATFHDASCSAFYFRDDVAADDDYRSSEVKARRLPMARGGALRRGHWPLYYRSTLVVKICHAELCRTDREHTPIAFLWLRSPEPGAFDERYDVDLMQRMSRAIAPIVTRCVQATKPTYDFRRQQSAAQ